MRFIQDRRRLLLARLLSIGDQNLLPKRFCTTSASVFDREPSRVLHFRNLGSDVGEDDIRNLVLPFGPVNQVLRMRKHNQALLEMNQLTDAISVFNKFSSKTPMLKGWPVFVNYSVRQELQMEERENRVLYIIIHNPLAHVTAEAIGHVFSPHGVVEKVSLFENEAGLQGMVQFASLESAAHAKSCLNGHDLFDGCCNLEIHFSKFNEIESRCDTNTDQERDFTKRPASTANSILGRPEPVVKQEPDLPLGMTGKIQRRVLLVSNFHPESMDEDKLFNVISNYGRVERILKIRPDQALVQVGDGFQAELAMIYLPGTQLYGRLLEVKLSKWEVVKRSGSRLFPDSMNSFTRDRVKHLRRPGLVLHVSNLSSNTQEEDLLEHLPGSRYASIFERAEKTQALVQFTNEEKAAEALASKHGSRLQDSVMQIRFSRVCRLNTRHY